MANGNTKVVEEMKHMLEQGKVPDPEMRDRLLFTAIIDIYENIEALQPALVFYKVGLWFAAALGTGVLSLIIGILTGKVEVIFK